MGRSSLYGKSAQFDVLVLEEFGFPVWVILVNGVDQVYM